MSVIKHLATLERDVAIAKARELVRPPGSGWINPYTGVHRYWKRDRTGTWVPKPAYHRERALRLMAELPVDVLHWHDALCPDRLLGDGQVASRQIWEALDEESQRFRLEHPDELPW